MTAEDSLPTWGQIQEEMREERERIAKQTNDTLGLIKKMRGGTALRKAVLDCMDDGDYNSDIPVEIVDSPVGNKQAWEKRGPIRHIYVDQKCGVCEDYYFGDVYIPLPDGKFFKFHYS